MFTRKLAIKNLVSRRSYFLFGPRAVGKSTLIRLAMPDARVYDLLDAEQYGRLVRQPSLIEEETQAKTVVVIDEIQKLPRLLDEVHRLIEKRGQRFLMTGSSARKLRRGGANLLAGRAFRADLFPLTAAEIDHFDLLTYLNTTGLPEFYAGEDSAEFLRAYVGTYLREEIFAEGLTRNLGAFSRFLDVIALVNGQEIQRSEIASDCGVPVRTLEGYFSILQDTLLAFSVPAFAKTVKRKAIRRPKIWLFDVGVVSALTHRGTIQAGTAQFGQALEHFIALELRAYLSYARSQLALQYWRSTSKFEVDFVVGQELAVEVKGTDQVRDKHLKGLRALAEEGLIRQYAVVSCDPQIRKTQDGIMIYPAQEFLQRLWNGKLLADNTSNL